MLANLRALFGVVVDIVLLRRGPEHMPASPALLVILLVLVTAIFAIVATAFGLPASVWAWTLALTVSFNLIWYRVGLQLANKPERFTQTMNAMYGVQVVFLPVLMPLKITLFAQMAAKQPLPASMAMPFLLLVVWSFVLNVRIVRSAFDWPWPAAIIMVLAQEFALVLTAAALFGVNAATA